jgi:hypothetical protein
MILCFILVLKKYVIIVVNMINLMKSVFTLFVVDIFFFRAIMKELRNKRSEKIEKKNLEKTEDAVLRFHQSIGKRL